MNGCFFWLQWVLATVVSFLLSLYWIEIDIKPHVSVIEGVIGGAIIGFAQGFILQQRLAIAPQWLLVNVVSWGLIATTNVGAIGWIAPQTLQLGGRLIYGSLQGALAGALLGVGQWIILKQQLTRARMWILVSAASWATVGIGWVVGGFLRQATHLFLSEVVGLASTWFIVAAITGINLIWLLRGERT